MTCLYAGPVSKEFIVVLGNEDGELVMLRSDAPFNVTAKFKRPLPGKIEEIPVVELASKGGGKIGFKPLPTPVATPQGEVDIEAGQAGFDFDEGSALLFMLVAFAEGAKRWVQWGAPWTQLPVKSKVQPSDMGNLEASMS